MMTELTGYSGKLLSQLRKAGASIGDIVRVTRGEQVFEGTLMPKSGPGGDRYIVVKLSNGYNVGIELTEDVRIEKTKVGPKPRFARPRVPERKAGLNRVSIISTGGTIASRVDYRTGAVHAALSAHDLYSVVPELSEIADVEATVLYSLYSENITPKHWSGMALDIARHITDGVDGVVVTHGTDTMGYTAAALSFALQSPPVPVVIVGSQRSSDRPSSDAAMNLIGAVRAASKAPFAEVVVAMHASTSDEKIAIHRGTKVRKCHTSRRDAFRSINVKPIAYVEGERIEVTMEDYLPRDKTRALSLRAKFDEKVALVKFHPGFSPKIVDWYAREGYHGLILEGTGLGHVGKHCFPHIKRAVRSGLLVGMTSQCIWGRINMNVYETGRDLLDLGVIPLGDMLPETALVKSMWALGEAKNLDEAKDLMLTNFAHEFLSRTSY